MSIDSPIEAGCSAEACHGGGVVRDGSIVNVVEQQPYDPQLDDGVIVLHLRVPGGPAAIKKVVEDIEQKVRLPLTRLSTPWGELPVTFGWAYHNDEVRLGLESYELHRTFEKYLKLAAASRLVDLPNDTVKRRRAADLNCEEECDPPSA